jgi:YjbE family integral membrane protein
MYRAHFLIMTFKEESMEFHLTLIIGVIQIMLIDLALCGDNIGIIALATRHLSEKHAKKASLIGISGAIALRVIFACFLTLIISIEGLPIKLIGGLILLNITWSFIKPSQRNQHSKIKRTSGFWGAVASIIIADISMSLDNVLAIASAANGSISLIIFGIALNIPIIFWGSRFVSSLMKKYPLVIYIGGAVLAQTSFKMILEDNITQNYLNLTHAFSTLFPWSIALVVLLYGFYASRRINLESYACFARNDKK